MDNSTSDSLTSLSSDVLLHLVLFLPLPDLLCISVANKTFATLIHAKNEDSEWMWKQRCHSVLIEQARNNQRFYEHAETTSRGAKSEGEDVSHSRKEREVVMPTLEEIKMSTGVLNWKEELQLLSTYTWYVFVFEQLIQ